MTEIQEPVWAYVAGVIGFILLFIICALLVRVLAILIEIACFFGGIGGICYLVNTGAIKHWEQLGLAVLILGGGLAFISATAELYTKSSSS